VIVINTKDDVVEGGTDRRAADGAAVGVPARTPPQRSTAGVR